MRPPDARQETRSPPQPAGEADGPSESESACATWVPLVKPPRPAQYGLMRDRYRTPDGWTVEVLQLAAGDRLRIRHHGFYVADVVNGR